MPKRRAGKILTFGTHLMDSLRSCLIQDLAANTAGHLARFGRMSQPPS